MAITALDIKDKQFTTKFRGYNEQEVDEFLDIIVDDYEDLVRDNRELAARVKELEEKLAYFDEMKESLSQSVILAQETAEKVKASAADESANLINKANFNATHLVEEAKSKASEILRDATDEAKRVAIETEELKRQSRVFHQRLLAAVEGQLSLASAPEWGELLQPTAIYLQNSDAAFKEVVEKFWMNMYQIQMTQLHLMQLVNSLLMKWLNFNVALLKVISKLKISLVQKLMKQTNLFQLQLTLVFQTLSRVK